VGEAVGALGRRALQLEMARPDLMGLRAGDQAEPKQDRERPERSQHH
jgi:hypothetical protein